MCQARPCNAPLTPARRQPPSAPFRRPDPRSQSRPGVLAGFTHPPHPSPPPSPGPAEQAGPGPTPPGASPIATSRAPPGRRDPARSSQAGRVQRGSGEGWPRSPGLRGGPARAEEANQPLSANTRWLLSPRAPRRSAGHLPPPRPLEWGRGQGVGRRAPLGGRAPATGLPPNCQLTGPAARARFLLAAPRRTAHVSARALALRGRREGAAARGGGAGKFAGGVGG